MLAVEDLVERLIETLRAAHQLRNTYIVFTSDNGFHLGQHRLPAGKNSAYEEDIRVPLIVRGPRVPAGGIVEHLAGNIDLAPTFAELGGVEPPGFVDGRSLVRFLHRREPSSKNWRQGLLLEAGFRDHFHEGQMVRQRDRDRIDRAGTKAWIPNPSLPRPRNVTAARLTPFVRSISTLVI